MKGIVCFILCFGISGPVEKVAASDSFCTVYENAVKNEMRFTQGEIDALRVQTKRDLLALKKIYEARCQGGS